MAKLSPPTPKKPVRTASNAVVSFNGRMKGYESISVRPIDNGYIVSRSTEKGYSETYSATKPKIEVPAAPKARK